MGAEKAKTDRRAVYTQKIIKDTLLEMLEQTSFDKITVAALCRRAGLNRSTFYLHYRDMPAVFEALLDDAIATLDSLVEHLTLICEGRERQCMNPFSQATKEKYHVIFQDDTLTGRLLDKLAGRFRHEIVQEFTTDGKLSPRQAEALFLFQLSGSFAVSRRMRDCEGEEWDELRRAMDTFIRDGFQRYFGATAGKIGPGCSAAGSAAP